VTDRGQPGDAHRPLHPYTIGLLQTIPRLGRRVKERLLPIPGSAPDPFSVPQGCAFRPRCPVAHSGCHEPVRMIEAESGHEVQCNLYYR
jgi:oligopeptide/dipeptide ABC transporter ATP-binding protein